jgi:hypothetical protein
LAFQVTIDLSNLIISYDTIPYLARKPVWATIKNGFINGNDTFLAQVTFSQISLVYL